MERFEIDYRGTRIGLTRDDERFGLLINGIVRDHGAVKEALRLGSPVQTDYEFHEFIEALIIREGSTLTAVLTSGDQELLRRSFQ